MNFSKNKNLILSGICAVLFLTGFFTNDPFGLFEFSYKKAAPLLKNIIRSDIKKIEVKQGDSSRLIFESMNENWSVKAVDSPVPFTANAKKINDAIEELLKVKKYHDVSSSKEKHAEFEVSSDKFHIVLFSSKGQVLADIFFGKSGAAFGSTLIRLASDDTVYSAKGNFKGQWNQSIDSFRDKKIVNFVKENVAAVEFIGEKSYKLTKTENAWQLQSKTIAMAADTNKVNGILNIITSLEGAGFFNDPNMPKPYAKIVVTLTSGVQEEIFINGPSKNDEFLIKSLYMQGPDWMTLPKYRVESLLNDISYFEQKAPPPSGTAPPGIQQPPPGPPLR